MVQSCASPVHVLARKEPLTDGARQSPTHKMVAMRQAFFSLLLVHAAQCWLYPLASASATDRSTTKAAQRQRLTHARRQHACAAHTVGPHHHARATLRLAATEPAPAPGSTSNPNAPGDVDSDVEKAVGSLAATIVALIAGNQATAQARA